MFSKEYLILEASTKDIAKHIWNVFCVVELDCLTNIFLHNCVFVLLMIDFAFEVANKLVDSCWLCQLIWLWVSKLVPTYFLLVWIQIFLFSSIKLTSNHNDFKILITLIPNRCVTYPTPNYSRTGKRIILIFLVTENLGERMVP